MEEGEIYSPIKGAVWSGSADYGGNVLNRGNAFSTCSHIAHNTLPHAHTQQRKVEEQKEKVEMNTLFRPVQSQKVSSGADPKSVLCIFYKQGQCTKGDKCKFSHDLSLEGKTEKKSLYIDSRDLEEGTCDVT